MRQREIDGERKKNKDRETERTDRQKEGEKERREGTERKITSLCDEIERRIWLNTHKSFKYTPKTVSLPISDRFSVLLSPYPCTINTVRFNVGVSQRGSQRRRKHSPSQGSVSRGKASYKSSGL